MSRKETNKYYFSVEGETEQWYLQWLQKQINNHPDSKLKVQFDIKVEKNPLKYAKKINTLSKVQAVHVFDYEEASNEPAFKTTLDYMKEAELKTKKVKYQLAYTNFCFELWIILHKRKFSTSLPNKNGYLSTINSVYSQSFESLLQYKHKDNFEKILNKLSIEDVKTAISNAYYIDNKNKENNNTLIIYRNYKFYRNNPSLSIHEYINKIFKDVGLIN
ncbi:MAG: RloB family protein [Bacilli bacterium]|nr:RloB family protein [Bacilli bacterium]